MPIKPNIALAATCLCALLCASAFMACDDNDEKGSNDPIHTPDASSDSDADTQMPPDGSEPDPDAASVEWCQLMSPKSAALSVGQKLTAYAEVYVKDRTEGAGQTANGVRGQLGVVAADSVATAADWTWIEATFNPNFDDASGNHDEHMADFSASVVGEFAYAFRFQVEGGAWFYCDTDGHSASNAELGFSLEALGRLSVTQAQPASVGWCRLQNASEVIQVQQDFTAYGQVFVEGLTAGNADNARITGQLGAGPVGSSAQDWPASAWVTATHNASADLTSLGANDSEYMATLTSIPVGTYAYAFRFQVDDGSWLYCDSDGHDGTPGGFSIEKQGTLSVEAAATAQVGWCQMVGNSPTWITVMEGNERFTAYAQLYVAGITDQGFNVDSARVRGQLGYGALPDTLLDVDNWNWQWIAATHNASADPNSLSVNDSEYMATLTSISVGTYAYAFRFQVDDGAWFYCDTDGNDGAPGSLSLEKLGELIVEAP
ncbi:MAG: hypothetical protein LBM75_06505 [Myxococcales bacterium]|jgi:hypothetical protein|nr:hypothetical protein [Myxococcales bacterium]